MHVNKALAGRTIEISATHFVEHVAHFRGICAVPLARLLRGAACTAQAETSIMKKPSKSELPLTFDHRPPPSASNGTRSWSATFYDVFSVDTRSLAVYRFGRIVEYV